MAPMFSSISSQAEVLQDEGQVKATPQLADFTLTQTTDSKAPPNSTLSLLDALQPSSLLFSRGVDSMFFFFLSTNLNHSSSMILNLNWLSISFLPAQRDGRVLSSKASESRYSHLHRRFTKSNIDEALLQQLKRVDRTKRKLEITNKVREQARANKVNMYRAYRIGELPDIEIKNEELILPLQALAQKDTDIARQLFSGMDCSPII